MQNFKLGNSLIEIIAFKLLFIGENNNGARHIALCESAFSENRYEKIVYVCFYYQIFSEVYVFLTFCMCCCLVVFALVFTQPKTPQDCCKQSILQNCYSLSTSQQSCKFRQVATRLLKEDLLQLVICGLVKIFKKTCSKPLGNKFDNQLARSLLTTCNSRVVNRLSQDMRSQILILMGLIIKSFR